MELENEQQNCEEQKNTGGSLMSGLIIKTDVHFLKSLPFAFWETSINKAFLYPTEVRSTAHSCR